MPYIIDVSAGGVATTHARIMIEAPSLPVVVDAFNATVTATRYMPHTDHSNNTSKIIIVTPPYSINQVEPTIAFSNTCQSTNYTSFKF